MENGLALDEMDSFRYICGAEQKFSTRGIRMSGVVGKPNEPFERALKRFTKSCEKNGIISDVKKRQRYEKPSEEKKRVETAARRKRLKELADANRKRLY